MAALVVLVIFERRRPCGARCTGHLRASRLTVPPSPGEGEFVRSRRAIFGAVGLNKPASNCKSLFWNGLGRLPNWQSTAPKILSGLRIERALRTFQATACWFGLAGLVTQRY